MGWRIEIQATDLTSTNDSIDAMQRWRVGVVRCKSRKITISPWTSIVCQTLFGWIGDGYVFSAVSSMNNVLVTDTVYVRSRLRRVLYAGSHLV